MLLFAPLDTLVGKCLVKHGYEKTWVPLLSAYPRVQALALPFPKDKQHE